MDLEKNPPPTVAILYKKKYNCKRKNVLQLKQLTPCMIIA